MALGLLFLLSTLCSSPIMQGGWYGSHEVLRPIARTLAAYHEVAAGDLYPRWVTTAYLGKGAPLFNFYSPAFSLLGAYLHALGVPLLVAMKLVTFALFLLGAVGLYLWVRPHLGHLPALVAAVLYLFAPYHFVDVYVRGATAEFASLAPLPFVFLGIDLLIERSTVRGYAVLATACAGVVLSHFLGALMIAPFAVVYALARAMRARVWWKAAGRVGFGALLGAAMSAFYWLPALVESASLSAERLRINNSGYLSPYVHFVHPWQWFDTTWGFGTSVPDGARDEMSFQIGTVAVCAIAASLLVVWLCDEARRRFLLLTLGLAGAALWLTSPASRGWYSLLRPYELVQFPWRFLGVMTLFVSAAGAAFVWVLVQRRQGLGRLAVVAVISSLVILSVPQRRVERVLSLKDDVAALDEAVSADLFSRKYGNSDEYLPRDAGIDAANFARVPEKPWGIGGVEVSGVRLGRTDVSFDVAAPAGEGIAVVPWHTFPGWKATLDGREWPIKPGPDGLIALWVPEGRHAARVRFGTTPSRVMGWLLALGALATLGGLALRDRALHRRGGLP